MKRLLATLLWTVITITCTATTADAAQEANPPNIVFVLVDDLGWSDMGYLGSTSYRTPRIDALAEQGMVFTDFYSAGPVCSPTRASVLTGQNPARINITTYLLDAQRDAQRGQRHELPHETVTIAEVLHESGYISGYFGKWHLGYRQEDWADQHGFDIALGGMDLPQAWSVAHPDEPMPMIDRGQGHLRFFSPHHLTFMENGPEGEYLTDRLTNETINFIRENKDGPFLAFLSFHTVHTPLQPKEDVLEDCLQHITALGLIDAESATLRRAKQFQNNPHYAAMVGHLDENVGRLLDAIDEMGIANNTIVVFTSDNGGKGQVTSNLPWRGMKHNLYEGGIRVPLIVRYPGHIEAGVTDDTPLISDDFMPTLLDMVGAEDPRQGRGVDGRSFAGLLLGEDGEDYERDLCWHYPHSRNEGAIRQGDWKLLIRYNDDEPNELYNLTEDPGEKNDVYEQHAERAEAMEVAFATWSERVIGRFPE